MRVLLLEFWWTMLCERGKNNDQETSRETKKKGKTFLRRAISHSRVALIDRWATILKLPIKLYHEPRFNFYYFHSICLIFSLSHLSFASIIHIWCRVGGDKLKEVVNSALWPVILLSHGAYPAITNLSINSQPCVQACICSSRAVRDSVWIKLVEREHSTSAANANLWLVSEAKKKFL